MNNCIDVWYGEIAVENRRIFDHWALLDDKERYKADSFRNEKLRNRYISVRGKLKRLLAKYTNENPDKLKIAYQKHGKPYLSDYENLEFNLSHSGNKIIVAIGTNCQLGADIEVWKDKISCSAIVQKCFSEQEINYWEALPDQHKQSEFYKFWTRKEAFVKAVGRGIAVGLRQCVISPQQPEQFLSIPHSYGVASDWRIVDLNLDQGVSGAVVVRDRNYGYCIKTRSLD